MPAEPATVADYLASLPDDRRKALQAIRRTVRKHLPKGYSEGVQYGMLGYFVPHKIYPHGYHCDPRQPLPFVGFASQKNHIGLYLFCVYIDADVHRWFVDAWKASGKKLDMGKACVRVKDLDGVPLDVLGELISRCPCEEFIAHYEANLPDSVRAKRAAKETSAAGRPTAKKSTPRKAVKKQAPKSATAKKKVTKRAASKPAKSTSKKAARRASS